MKEEVKNAIEESCKTCTTCAINATKSKRFKVAIGIDDLRFNHTVAVDVMHLMGRAVLNVVDEATHFNGALFLKNQSFQTVGKSLVRCWLRIYLGLPDYLHIDQGTTLISKEFNECAEAEGITVLKAPFESPSTICYVERYHAPQQASYTKNRQSLPCT